MGPSFLLQNGAVYDAAARAFTQRDLAIVDGRVAAHRPGQRYDHVIDAAGCLVCPGLIDFHTHVLAADTGIPADSISFCNGVTTVVDAGTAGASHYPLFHATAVAGSRTRVLAMLLAASGGQATARYPESMDPARFDEAAILDAFARWPGELAALKARFSAPLLAGLDPHRCLDRLLALAGKAGVPLVLHVTDCALPLDELAARLRPGDVLCHVYHPRGHTCLDAGGRVLPGLLQARARGVLFDACHGVTNFDLEVCRAAVAQGFVPDIVSTDSTRAGSFLPPLHSLPRLLSLYLALGLPLESVLACATAAPARALGRPELASLAVGAVADIAVFRLKEAPVAFTDKAGHRLDGRRVLVPQMAFKGGEAAYCQADFA